VGHEDGGELEALLDRADLLAQAAADAGIQRRERLIQQRIRGCTTRARASATRWRWPPESSAG
jgi:hypothetical protein